ncbi:sulfite oxidase mitochondrial precursor [Trametes punicea]|nr:sulfite oxidase mitochondrial precursor [Trametes punicea]
MNHYGAVPPRFVEWEGKPDRKRVASEILKTKQSQVWIPRITEFQFVPLPKTNPVLVGHCWKEYHEALGLKGIVDFSWAAALTEKPGMIHLLDFPYNGETSRSKLINSKVTENKWHFVRNHSGVPDIDEEAFELEIGGLVNEPVKLTMKDLKDPSKFPQVEVTITIQCSGTRCIEQIQEYPGEGDELINAPWGEGAIGTAVYRGVPLKKVLKLACGGIKLEAQHLEFIGADTYCKCVRNNEEVILAWEMNGKPLPKIHGYPLRVVVRGYIGARSTKRLGPVQSQEYLYFTQQIGKQNAKYSNGFSIQNMPVSSAIFSPRDKQVVIHGGQVELKGWSYSGGGNWVERFEVSPDGGHVWYAVDQDDMTEKHYHAWRLWKINVPVDAEGWLEFCVRTWDSSNNPEPTFVRSAWNWDLHVTSSCHRIKVYSVNTSRPATAHRLAELRARGESLDLTRPIPWSLESLEEYLKAVRKHPREPRN